MSYRRRQDSEGELPKLYSIHLSEVCSIQAYGVFVKIPGYRKNGLVHKSQMSNNKVEHPDDVTEMGERVYCKVISIDNETAKIGMSMKVVNQSTGKDLDPAQVQTSQDEQRRKTGHMRGTPRIELGAVLDTVCKKCGGRGHLSQDCFHKPGSKSYEILPDNDYRNAQDGTERGDTDRHHKKRKKEKKSKKQKKEKKKRRKEESSYSDSDSDSYKKSKKKRKRRKNSSDSSDSGSDSDAGSDDNDRSWKKRRQDSSGPPEHGSAGLPNRSQYHSPEGADRKRAGDRNNDARRRSLGDDDRGFRQPARSGHFSNETEREFDRGAPPRRDQYQGARHDGKAGFDRRDSGDGFPGQRRGDNRRGEERYPEERRRDNFSKRN